MRKENLHLRLKSSLLLLCLFLISSCKQQFTVMENHVGFNQVTLSKAELCQAKNRRSFSKIARSSKVNDIRISPAYWNDSLHMGIIDVNFVSKYSWVALPFYVNQKGELYQLFSSDTLLKKQITNADVILQEMNVTNDKDQSFIRERVKIGKICLSLTRSMDSNVKEIPVLKKYYLKNMEW